MVNLRVLYLQSNGMHTSVAPPSCPPIPNRPDQVGFCYRVPSPSPDPSFWSLPPPSASFPCPLHCCSPQSLALLLVTSDPSPRQRPRSHREHQRARVLHQPGHPQYLQQPHQGNRPPSRDPPHTGPAPPPSRPLPGGGPSHLPMPRCPPPAPRLPSTSHHSAWLLPSLPPSFCRALPGAASPAQPSYGTSRKCAQTCRYGSPGGRPRSAALWPPPAPIPSACPSPPSTGRVSGDR